ncbi:Fibronectin-binding protein [Acidisarcina polymorpha]|uniref:Fibronectin-binding protein n=1 Tax=Acidisarcina polymorpha TaxID=2211140 RepID=A0A2Z5FX80_9BACT|nr:hypothetical protein [Acidisarcina polymorpha]AXC11097.1 Fibronectin-binding protein [Acidisarcina polymorpha]
MNSAGKHAVVTLLMISIAGCVEKKTTPIQPATAQAPSTDAGKPGALYPPPLTSTQSQPEQPPPPPAPEVAETEPAPAPEPPPQKTKKPTGTTRKPKPSASSPSSKTGTNPSDNGDAASAAAQTPVPASPAPQNEQSPTVLASSGEPAPASPIGHLSTGDVSGQTQTRKETADLITGTENGLNGIKRALSAQEQETANQIRAFLTKAKAALGNEDLDGALILATKAKVLLDELNKT